MTFAICCSIRFTSTITIFFISSLCCLNCVGFVAAHTLPVLYERYEDQVDGFVFSAVDQFQHHYQKLDAGVLSRIPKGNLKGKKYE